MGSLSRTKGAQFERDIVRAFKDAGIDAKRTAPLQTHKQNNADDLIVDGVGGIECKRRRSSFKIIYEAFEQGEPNAVIIRDDRKAPLIVFALDDFISRETGD